MDASCEYEWKQGEKCEREEGYVAAALLYHFDRKFTNSENLLAEMADKFSFEF